MKEIFRNARNYFCRQKQDVMEGIRSREPLRVGRSLTKLFILGVAIIFLLPSREDQVWTIRIVSFLISPPNEVGDTLAGLAGVLAFLWIIVTVWLQSDELAEQRKQLEKQTQEFSTMNSAMAAQRFETAFFELLSAFLNLVGEIDLVESGGSRTIGRDCFEVFCKRLKNTYARMPKNDNEEEIVFTAYQKFWSKHNVELGHYYRFLFNSFRLISESEHKRDYHGKLLRAIISDQELILLFYNAMMPVGRDFRRYIIEFDLLDNLPRDRLLNPSHLKYLSVERGWKE